MLHRDGAVISLGEVPISQDQLFGSFGTIQSQTGRLDGEALCEFHRHLDSENIDEHVRNGGRLSPALVAAWHADCAEHADALGSGSATLPRELEFIRARELEQVRKPLNGYSLFPVDRSVPLGAREHTYRRRVGQGEAVLTRGDNENYGHAQSARLEEKFPVVYVVSSVRQNYFEMRSTDFAGVQQYAADLRVAYRAVDERINRLIFSGDTKTGIPGALKHPGLMQKSLGVTIGGASSSSNAAILAAIHTLVDTPATLSGESMQPTVLAVSPKIFRFLAQTRMDSGTDTTLLEFFLAGQDKTNGIREIRKIIELAGIGPSGEDGLFAFRDEVDSIGIIEVMPTMPMPVYQAGALTWLTLVIAATGGVVMPNVGTNILGLATAG